MLPTASLLTVFSLLAGSVLAQEDWNYQQKGDDWLGLCQTGRRQSPIDIQLDEVQVVKKDKPLVFVNYDRLTQARIEVDHHTVRARPTSPHGISIYGGGLPGKYIFDHVHFHWPSEHTINKRRLILEAHLVHYNRIYNNTDEAASDPEGIAVLGVLYTEGKANIELFKIERGAREENMMILLNLTNLLPFDKSQFFRYKGSLTTPPCAESVIWTIFRNYAQASSLQVAAFRGLLPEDEQHIDTYRKLQDRNQRVVELWKTRRSFWGVNGVDNLGVTPNPSLLFAVLPGLSNSLYQSKFLRKFG